jgi:hypothetical protein
MLRGQFFFHQSQEMLSEEPDTLDSPQEKTARLSTRRPLLLISNLLLPCAHSLFKMIFFALRRQTQPLSAHIAYNFWSILYRLRRHDLHVVFNRLYDSGGCSAVCFGNNY